MDENSPPRSFPERADALNLSVESAPEHDQRVHGRKDAFRITVEFTDLIAVSCVTAEETAAVLFQEFLQYRVQVLRM